MLEFVRPFSIAAGQKSPAVARLPQAKSRLRIVLALFAIGATVNVYARTTPGQYSVTKYGAKGDGVAMDTAAIQKAIDAAAKHHGTVTFKPGTYLTGSLFIKSGVHFEVGEGVTLMGSQKLADYPVMPTRVAGIEMNWPAGLINVYEQADVTIDGAGTIDGDGKVFWDSYWALRKTYEPKGLRWASDYDAQRPRLVVFYKSHDVKFGGGLNLRRSGFWTVHICYSDKVAVDGVVIRNNEGGRGPSTDGIDIDSSTHILVAHADIANNDDDICLKSGRDADGLRVNKPTEHVVIRDSIIRAGAAGVTFGSETSGGFRDIEAYNLKVLKPVPNGILFKSAHTRGGLGEDIRIHDIDMDGVATPISITMNWNPSYSYATIPPDQKNYPAYWTVLTTHVPADKGLPHFQDVHIWNIKAVGARRAFSVSAYPNAPLINFRFDHIDISAQTAGMIADAKDWTFSTTEIKTADGSTVAVKDSTDVTGLPSK